MRLRRSGLLRRTNHYNVGSVAREISGCGTGGRRGHIWR